LIEALLFGFFRLGLGGILGLSFFPYKIGVKKRRRELKLSYLKMIKLSALSDSSSLKKISELNELLMFY